MHWRSAIGVAVVQLLATTVALQLFQASNFVSTRNNSFLKLIQEPTDECIINIGEISKPKILNESFKSLRVSTQRVTSKGGTEYLPENCLQHQNDVEDENIDNYSQDSKYAMKKQGLSLTNRFARLPSERVSTFEERRFKVRQNERRSRSRDIEIRQNVELRLVQNRKFDRRNIREVDRKINHRINERRVSRNENTRSLIMDRQFRDSPIRQENRLNRNENRREREMINGKRNYILERRTRSDVQQNILTRRQENIQQSETRRFREIRENEILNKENRRISAGRILSRRENERSDIRNEKRISISMNRNDNFRKESRDLVARNLNNRFRNGRELNKMQQVSRLSESTARFEETTQQREAARTLKHRENRIESRQTLKLENRIDGRLNRRILERNSQVRETKNIISARLTNEFIRQDNRIQTESRSRNLNEHRLVNNRKSINEERRFNPSQELRRSEQTIENKRSLLDINNRDDSRISNRYSKERRMEQRTDFRIVARRSTNSERRNRENISVRKDQRVQKMFRSTVSRSIESDIKSSSNIRENQVGETYLDRKIKIHSNLNEQDMIAKRQTSARNIFSIRRINRFENQRNNMGKMTYSQQLSRDSNKILVKENSSIENNNENTIWESIIKGMKRINYFLSDKEYISNQPTYEKSKFKTVVSNSLMLGIFSFQMFGLIKTK